MLELVGAKRSFGCDLLVTTGSAVTRSSSLCPGMVVRMAQVKKDEQFELWVVGVRMMVDIFELG